MGSCTVTSFTPSAKVTWRTRLVFRSSRPRDGAFCEEAMASARVSKSDVIAKMREANCLSLDQAQAVVLETTGDVSVLHGDTLDERLVEGVKVV